MRCDAMRARRKGPGPVICDFGTGKGVARRVGLIVWWYSRVGCKPEGWDLERRRGGAARSGEGRCTGYTLYRCTGLVVIAANCIGAELGASSRVAGSATLGHLARACVALHILPCE